MVNRISSCFDRLTTNLNPKKWDTSAKRVAEIAAFILATCIIAIIVSSLMVKYPGASGAFFTLFGIGGTGSIVILILALMQHRKSHTLKIGNKITIKPPEIEVNSTPPTGNIPSFTKEGMEQEC